MCQSSPVFLTDFLHLCIFAGIYPNDLFFIKMKVSLRSAHSLKNMSRFRLIKRNFFLRPVLRAGDTSLNERNLQNSFPPFFSSSSCCNSNFERKYLPTRMCEVSAWVLKCGIFRVEKRFKYQERFILCFLWALND